MLSGLKKKQRCVYILGTRTLVGRVVDLIGLRLCRQILKYIYREKFRAYRKNFGSQFHKKEIKLVMRFPQLRATGVGPLLLSGWNLRDSFPFVF